MINFFKESFKKDNTPSHFRNKNEIPKDHQMYIHVVDKHVADLKAKNIAEIKKNSISLTKEFGKDIPLKINHLYSWIIEDFQQYGFDDIKIPPLFLTPYDPSSDKIATAGSNSHIEIRNYSKIENKELKQLYFLKLLAHETYHAVSPVSLDLSFKKIPETEKYSISYKPGATGMVYNETSPEDIGAFEEGLAVRFEEKIFEKIKTLFSEETVQIYESDKESVKKEFQKNNTHDPEASPHFILRERAKTKGDLYKVSGYEGCVKLVNYVQSQIPDFEILIEKARLQRKTLDLARAIENQFGEGSYRLIMTATVHKASDVLETIQHKS